MANHSRRLTRVSPSLLAAIAVAAAVLVGLLFVWTAIEPPQGGPQTSTNAPGTSKQP